MTRKTPSASDRARRPHFEFKRFLAVGLMAATLAACNTGETFTRGQKVTPDQLEQVPVGSSKEQVLLALGTPTTTGLADGEALYYISQTSRRALAYQRPSVKDRRILVVYLDGNEEVREIAEYGLKDGRVFDYLSRRTPTGGSDLAFISQILGGLVAPTL